MSNKRKPRRDSSKCSIINRTVSFNIEDPFQLQLLESVDSWTNFSGSVKRLIAAALSGGAGVQVQTDAPVLVGAREVTVSVSAGAVSSDSEEWDPTELF